MYREIGGLVIELKERTGTPRLTSQEIVRIKRRFQKKWLFKRQEKNASTRDSGSGEQMHTPPAPGSFTVSGGELLDRLSLLTGVAHIVDQIKLRDGLDEDQVAAMHWDVDNEAG
jgi:hypothetical protein